MITPVFLLVLICAKINAIYIVEDNIRWTVRNANGSIHVPGKVPGGIYSDLHNAGIIGDILQGFNDVLTRWVAHDTWTYEGRFNGNILAYCYSYLGQQIFLPSRITVFIKTVTAEQLNHEVAKLSLHGVDTVAFIELNDSPIGSTNNMFVRYVFDIKPHLKEGENELKVIFASPIEVANARSNKHFTAPDCVPSLYNGECHANQIRKMQASFGWDWGPAFPSVGFWRPLQLEFYNRAIIRSVTTHTVKIDQHWHLKIKAYLETNSHIKLWKGQIRAELKVEGNQKIRMSKILTTNIKDDGTTEAELNMTISENVIRLWWPNGFGSQPLYDLRVSIYTDDVEVDSVEDHYKTVQIGFRTLEVVEEDASLKFGNNTAGHGLTFYFKINGYPIFMKGSNWIPAHILPEFGGNEETVDSLLLAAQDAHMAMLRVWGGGVYESDYFYQRCDQLGILIWQDFLFACSMYPADSEFLDTVRIEIEQNVKRLQHHTSIAVWAGNNENEVALRGNWYNTQSKFDKYKQEYIQLYVNTIKPIVETLDPGRRYLVSSPSNGKKSEEDGYIAENPYDSHYGDTHYYNYLDDNWNANIYPKTRFASEYGFQSLPSLSTMSTATKDKTDYSVQSDYSIHRQHSPLGYMYIENQITEHLKLKENENFEQYAFIPNQRYLKSGDNEEYFKKFVFYSQIAQAMAMKTETEYYRQSQADWYTMGALYWQLNDVWQAPSWSGIEYGGKWKMLHYYAKSFLAPVLVSPRLLSSGDVDVYLINDRFVPIIEGQIKVDAFNWNSLIPIKSEVYPANVEPLSAKKQDIKLDLWNHKDKDQVFLRFSLKAEGVPSSPFNFIFPKPLKSVQGLKEPNIEISVSKRSLSGSRQPYVYSVDIKVDTVVLFLWLETNKDGYFEDNGFIVTQPYLRVNYLSKSEITADDLQNSITYQYYMN